MHGCLVTATDTGVGKTILSAALTAALRAAGHPVQAYKPVVTGLDEIHPLWPADHELLARTAAMAPQRVAPERFGPAVSPHLAAARAGRTLEPARLVERARKAGRRGPVVVEGVGGLLAPLTEHWNVRDLARALGLPVIIAARPGLGTINHTLLTLEAARAGGLDVRAVVLTPWPGEPDEMQLSNRQTIARLGAVRVEGLGQVDAPDPALLAQAGRRLPYAQWLGPARPSLQLAPSASSF